MVALNSLTRKIQRLEDLRCQRNDFALRRDLWHTLAVGRTKRELADVAGIDDLDLIDRLFRAGFNAENVAAVSMIPVAMVAWGSGYVTEEERAAAMKAISQSKLMGNLESIAKFQSWLDSRPDPELLLLWADFTAAQHANASVHGGRPTLESAHQERILELAHEVALASGGFLGFGAICPGEQSVLDRVQSVFFDSTE